MVQECMLAIDQRWGLFDDDGNGEMTKNNEYTSIYNKVMES